MDQIIKRNYNSTVKRKLINKKTNHVDFFHKLTEESEEVKAEFIKQVDLDKLGFELADVCLVCFNWMHHYGLNPEKYIKDKIVINENH